MDLRSVDFTRFFQATHGHTPFPWQQTLVDLLDREERWPDVLDLPTGAGKTAALDAAVFHLALRAHEPTTVAFRVVLVVDRRLVVDDAFARAHKIENAVIDPSRVPTPGRTVVEEVSRRLRMLAGEGAPPLVAARLRGGTPLEDDWARTPTQPTILCSTVDQVGSRLLFRGYGVSNRMKPVHAGLLGEDTLILLDEAHLSEPFRQTLDAIREIGGAGVRTVLLTATPGKRGQRPFSLGSLDWTEPVLQRRLEAAKPAKLLKPIRNDPAGAFSREAGEMVNRLRRGGVSSPAVGIVVNRVALARAIFEELKTSVADAHIELVLMIGRSRAATRDWIVDQLSPFRTGNSDRSEAAPLLLVATQCLEVGVDLDLDGMVTQAASFDALRQRFGRLNRAGRPIAADGVIMTTADALNKKADDPVYGDRIRKTWDVLGQIAEGGVVDFGVASLDRRLKECTVDTVGIAAHRAEAPVLMPAYFDLWSQTSPPPLADPDVGLFLHGAEHAPADVSLVWRYDVTSSDLNEQRADLTAILKLVPPRTAETIDVPIWSAIAWLRGERGALLADIADVPGQGGPSATERNQWERTAFRWAGSDDPRTGYVTPAELQPGDLLVVPADYGGCDEFGWAPESTDHVVDVADTAALPYRGRRFAVRIARHMFRSDTIWSRVSAVLAASDGSAPLDELLEALPTDAAIDSDDQQIDQSVVRGVRAALKLLRNAEVGRTVRGGRVECHFPYASHDAGVILVATHGLRDATEPGQSPTTEDDTLSHTSSRPIGLKCHTDSVVAHVKRFARTLRLPTRITADLSLAAFLHDAGKADTRFQTMLAGGDWWNRTDGPVIAKSGRASPPGAWERAALPSGWRHEALSVRVAPSHPRFAHAQDPELVMWLIGTHHGLGRPFFGFADPQDGAARNELLGCLGVDAWHIGPGAGPQSPAFDFHGLDWAALFEGLRKRYGIWGLARLEAILRLADHRASQAERLS